jgi:hypothetical protein
MYCKYYTHIYIDTLYNNNIKHLLVILLLPKQSKYLDSICVNFYILTIYYLGILSIE